MTQVLSKEEDGRQESRPPLEEQSSPALVNFLESLSNSEYTRRSYLNQLKKFMKFNIEDPQELLLWDPKVIADNIIRFVISCRNAGRAQNLDADTRKMNRNILKSNACNCVVVQRIKAGTVATAGHSERE
jgi:hypothetical protein